MSLTHILVPVFAAVAMQALPTFANLGPTTLASEIITALNLPGIATNAYVTGLYSIATLTSFVAAAFVLKHGPIRAGQWALSCYFLGGLIIFAFPHPISFCFAACIWRCIYYADPSGGSHSYKSHTTSHEKYSIWH